MNVKRNEIKDLGKLGIKSMHWEVFARVYDQSFAQKHPQLLCLILSDF